MIWQVPGHGKQNPMNGTIGQKGNRFLLWVNSVGGYWVCLGDEIVLGQPLPLGVADVPILGDLSGRHARIRRGNEGYVIEAFRNVFLDGHKVDQIGLLSDGSRIQLGTGVRLVFRRPHTLSATARLDFASHHHTQPSVNAVLLMADSCILGPNPHSHVVCRDWPQEVVLFRCDNQLYCRTKGRMEIDGLPYTGRGGIRSNSRIQSDHFSLSLEPL